MAHFAKIENGVVTDVVVAEPEFIATGKLGNFSQFVQTSYNTRGGVHYDPETGLPSGNPQFRKNYAEIGGTYDRVRDAFIPVKPYPSFILNEETCIWDAPVPYPEDGQVYRWDEANLQWVVME